MMPMLRQIGLFTILLLAVLLPDRPLSAADNPGPSQEGSGPSAAEDLQALTTDLQKKRTAATDALTRIDSPSTLRDGAPPEVPESEVLERRTLLQQLVQTYERHLDEAQTLLHTYQRLQDATRQAQEWDGFPTPPPYSVLMVDELRDAEESVRLAEQGLMTRLTMIDRLIDVTASSLDDLQKQARQAAERAEGLPDSEQRAMMAWARDLAQLRERVMAARASMLDTSRKQVQAELSEARERAALAERQRRLAEQHIQFGEEDLKTIRSRLASAERELLADIEQAAADQTSQRVALAAAEKRLGDTRPAASPRSSRTPARTNHPAAAAEALELQRARLDTANLKVDLLRQLLDGVRQEREIWERRFASAHGTIPPAEERDDLAKLTSTQKLLHGWREYGFQQLALAGGRISELTGRIDATAPTAPPKHLTDMVRVYRQQEALYRRALQQTEDLITLIGRRQTEIAHRQAELPWSTRIQEWGSAVAGIVRDGWTIEVFAAEDTIEVDGKTITGRRSITIGKILKALAILVGGYWLSRLLAGYAERKAITRFNMHPDVANIIRQWSLALLFSLLVIVTLMSVKIPLTAFAFLGGALAIAVGFGTQTLLKNIISGLLLLMERPLRVGDVIEVDGVRGTVTSIGLRSSTLRDANGVETLIPNSNLLERNLTNWTYSSYSKRYQLTIKVAAGADTRRVKDLLIALAQDHGQVLKEPEPYVLLDELTEGGLVFSLQYWIQIGPAADPARIASDLRFMIDTHFAEAQIARK